MAGGSHQPSEDEAALRERLERFRSLLRPPTESPSPRADERTKKEEADLETERKTAELQHLKDESDLRAQDQYYKDRKRYTGRLFWLMLGWVVVVLFLVIATGIEQPSAPPTATGWPLHHWLVAFDLPESVLLALVGSTTANVIGLFAIVALYLFPKRRPQDQRRDR